MVVGNDEETSETDDPRTTGDLKCNRMGPAATADRSLPQRAQACLLAPASELNVAYEYVQRPPHPSAGTTHEVTGMCSGWPVRLRRRLPTSLLRNRTPLPSNDLDWRSVGARDATRTIGASPAAQGKQRDARVDHEAVNVSRGPFGRSPKT